MTMEKRIFLTLAVIIFFFMHWAGWNETSRFSLTRAIVEEGRMETTSFAQETGDHISIGEHYFLDKAPGVSFLAIPIHAFSVLVFSTERPSENENILMMGGREREFVVPTHLSQAERFSMVVSTFLLSGLLTIATAYLLFLISKEFIKDKRIQYLVPIGYTLGTLAFSQALILQGHATSTFFAFAAFFVGYYTIKKRYFSSLQGGILAGILAGIAFLADYLALFAVIGIGLWLIFSRNPKVFLLYGVAFIAIAALLLVYNMIIFGNQFFLSYAVIYVERTGQLEDVNIKSFTNNLISAYFNPSFHNFRIATIFRMLFMPERGIFFYSPLLFLSIPGIYFLAKQRPALCIMILIIFFSLLWFFSIPYLPWWGGSSFGLRYLTLITPFLMIPIISAISKWHISIIIFLTVVSVFINVLGLQSPAGLNQELAGMDTEEYHVTMTSLTVIKNPLVDYYWPRFREYGINIPLVNSALVGKPFDIRSNVPLDGREFRVASTLLGSLFIRRSIMPLLIIALALSFIWFSCLRNTFWKYPLLASIIILFFLSFHFK